MSNVFLNALKMCAAVLVPCAATAQANCPTAEMVENGGIKFTGGPGTYEIHSRAPNGSILQFVDYDGLFSQNTIAYGVHVLSLANVENGALVEDSIWLFVFEDDIDALPEPVAGGTWSNTTTKLYQGDLEQEIVRHTWGQATTFTIGNCTLDAIPVRVDYASRDYNHVEEAMYFPSLGTAILTAYIDDQGTDTYTYQALGKP